MAAIWAGCSSGVSSNVSSCVTVAVWPTTRKAEVWYESKLLKAGCQWSGLKPGAEINYALTLSRRGAVRYCTPFIQRSYLWMSHVAELSENQEDKLALTCTTIQKKGTPEWEPRGQVGFTQDATWELIYYYLYWMSNLSSKREYVRISMLTERKVINSLIYCADWCTVIDND